MKKRLTLLPVLFLFALLSCYSGNAAAEAPRVPHEGFVYLTDVVPDAILEIRYYSTYNFLGARVDGYNAPIAILSAPAAAALKKASDDLRGQGYTLKVFDAYRPQTAVNHFVRWAKDIADAKRKADFYPEVDKTKLFDLGYIAAKSGHSRGSTVDLTIVDMRTGKEVDMGSPFDFFGEVSHHGTTKITAEQTAGREILKKAMLAAGFKLYDEEWWHYTLKDEPYPDTYFDFAVDCPAR